MDILEENAPAPRLCHLIKWPDFDGYGFNLHAERTNPGQFIGKIDADSPAQMAGLREGDRIVEVNGVNIANENHRQVVERIKSDPQQTRLLVLDPEADGWYRQRDQVVKSTQANVVYMKTPTPRPQPDSPRAKYHLQQQSPSTAGSSLETSDFNEQDSIEQAPPLKSTAPKSRSPPPMSPDSGKGDEEPAAAALTIEAEINHQAAPAKQRQQDEEAVSSSSSSATSNIIEPDSLSQTGASMSPSPAATAQVSNSL